MGKKERLRQYFAFLNRMTISPGCKKGDKSSWEPRFSAFKGMKASLVLRRKPRSKAKQTLDRLHSKDSIVACPATSDGDHKPSQ